MIHKLILYYSTYPSVRYATISIILIALCSALLGVILVLRRYSMIGDGLSHVTFGATAVATVLGLTTPVYVALPLTVLAAILILKLRENTKINGDAAIAMISTGALALGYLLLNLFGDEHSRASDACATLFGSGILSIKPIDALLCMALSAIVIFAFVVCYNKLFAVTFDEDFAASCGTKVGLYNTVIAIITAITIVIAMNLLGALLVSALVIFPALSAMRIFKTFRKVTLCAVCLSILNATIGISASLLLASPIGPTIVVADLTVFLLCCLIGAIKQHQ